MLARLRGLGAARSTATRAVAALSPAAAAAVRLNVTTAMPTMTTPDHTQPLPPHLQELRDGVLAGNRRALSKSITLVESTNAQHRADADALLVSLINFGEQKAAQGVGAGTATGARAHMRSASASTAPDAVDLYAHVPDEDKPAAVLAAQQGRPRTKLRLGISGTPGVGKSSFIESFGMHLTQKYGLKLAVLSIDPSSHVHGGSILGDKTRMQQLSMETSAYIRPSPSRGTLGGVAQNTLEAVTLCEAAGYDVILIESVGVGQSEVTIAQCCDAVLLLMGPGGGDELQGIKKGIMEVADMIVVTKADGALLSTARRTRNDYERSLSLSHSASRAYGWHPRVLLCSTQEDTATHMDAVWGTVLAFENAMLRPATEYTRHTRAVGGALAMGAHTAWASEASAQAAGSMSVLHAKRALQRRQWMWSQLGEELLARMRRFARADGDIERVELDLAANKVTPRVAAQRVLDLFLHTQVAALQEQAQQAAAADAAAK